MKQVKLFLLDLDGTVYLSGQLIDGAKQAIDDIRKSGRSICFLTNNSSVSHDDYVAKINNLGIECSSDEIYTSGDSAIRYLLNKHSNDSIYLLSTDKLRKQFVSSGIKLVEEKADVFVLAYDTTLEYSKLISATNHLNEGAKYVITHGDIVCPAKPYAVPDVGSMVEMLAMTTNRRPEVNCGKPSSAMGQAIAEKFSLECWQIAMVGDRLTTDLQFALNNNFVAITVLSGETTRQSYAECELKADYLLESIADIPQFLK